MTVALFTEDAEEYRTKNRSNKKIRDEATEMLSAIRITLVGYSKSDYKAFMEYLEQNADMLRYHIPYDEQESMRKICDDAWNRFSKESKLADVDLFDEVFGFYIPNNMPYVQGQPKVPRIERELDYFAKSTYTAFYKWISRPETYKQFNMHSDLKDRFKRVIDRQKRENKHIGSNKGYEQSDEDTFRMFIGD